MRFTFSSNYAIIKERLIKRSLKSVKETKNKMKKHNIIGSALLGVMLAFVLVMPAFASNSGSGSNKQNRENKRACIKTVQISQKAAIKTSKEKLKLAERNAMMTWKTSVESAKNLTGDERKAVMKAATETMRTSLKEAKRAHKVDQKTAKANIKDAVKACKSEKSSDDDSSHDEKEDESEHEEEHESGNHS